MLTSRFSSLGYANLVHIDKCLFLTIAELDRHTLNALVGAVLHCGDDAGVPALSAVRERALPVDLVTDIIGAGLRSGSELI